MLTPEEKQFRKERREKKALEKELKIRQDIVQSIKNITYEIDQIFYGYKKIIQKKFV